MSEAERTDAFMEIFQFITAEASHLAAAPMQNSGYFVNTSTKPVRGGIDHGPDICYIWEKERHRDRRVHWRKGAAVVFEIGPRTSDDILAEEQQVTLQGLKYTQEIMGCQMGRRFVFFFSFCGAAIDLWMLDRAGGLGSATVPINVKPDTLVRVIVGLGQLSSALLGADPKVTIEGDEVKIVIDPKQRSSPMDGKTPVWLA